MALIDPTLTDSLRTSEGYHSLQRTNVRLSGNLKYVYDGDALYLESINSTSYLASARFKAHKINITVPLPYAVKTFMQESSDLTEWYRIKPQNLNQATYPYEQRICNYEFGAYTDTTSPLSKNRIFAPLWVYDKLPEIFCIFRINNKSYKGDIKGLQRDAKLIKAIDMREGKNEYFDWIRKHVNSRDYRSDCVKVQYSGDNKEIAYYGFSAQNADWKWSHENIMDEYSANERMIMETNNDVTNGFSRNNLIHPSLFNLEFAFDDPEALDGWCQYVGMYFNSYNIDALDDNIIEVIRSFNPEAFFFTYHNGTFERTLEKKDPTLEVTSKVTAFRSETLPALAELKWLWIPPKNSIFRVTFGNITVYEFKFDSYNSIRQAKKALLDDFRSAKLNQVAMRMYEDGDRFFVTAVNTAKQYENLKLTLPSSIRSDYGFKVVNNTDLILSKFPEEDIISLNDVQYTITHRYRYIDYYVVRVDKPIQLDAVTNLELMSFIYPERMIGVISTHKDFDFSIDRSSHYDPVDSDPEANLKYFMDTINDQFYQGAWRPNSGQGSLQEYKTKVAGMVQEHFKSIDIPKEFCIKDIDTVTLEASQTVPNEYLRLQESTNPNSKDLNKITPFITKWAHSQGTNVYGRPYDLNLSLALRYDNFAPSFTNANRDLRTHTHSWYVIGEGLPPYITDARKALGYSRIQIAPEYIMQTFDGGDAYEHYLTHQVEGGYNMNCWSEMKKRDGTQDIYYTFFRGAEIEIRGNYEGYRFASILVTRDMANNDASVSDYISFIDNAKFKTLTCLIKFYIPDPVLTSLESGVPYMLDRSLLYFSNQVYSTQKIDAFGTDVISLDLYNTTSPKSLGGIEVDPREWFHFRNGTSYINIRKGDPVRWNGDFRDMLTVNDSFTWRTVRDDGSPIAEYMANGIVEVSADNFWCFRLQMRHYRNGGLPSPWRDYETDKNNWTGEGTILDKDNDWYMSKAISYYNSIYDVIVSARTNTKRYKQISFGAIANILNNYAIRYTYVDEEGITQSEKRCTVYEPSYFPILNSIRSEDNELKQLDGQQLIVPLYRYSGTYSPIFRTVHRAGNGVGVDMPISIQKIQTDHRYIKKYSTRSITNQIDREDRDYLQSEVFDRHTKLYSDETNYTVVNRNADLNVHQSWLSTIFKYEDTFEVISDKRTFDIRDLLQPIFLPLIADRDFVDGTMPRDRLLEILRTYVPKSTLSSMVLEDVQRYVFTDFYEGTLMKLYAVDKIISPEGKIIQYSQKNTFEYDMESDYGRVIIKRHQAQ